MILDYFDLRFVNPQTHSLSRHNKHRNDQAFQSKASLDHRLLSRIVLSVANFWGRAVRSYAETASLEILSRRDCSFFSEVWVGKRSDGYPNGSLDSGVRS